MAAQLIRLLFSSNKNVVALDRGSGFTMQYLVCTKYHLVLCLMPGAFHLTFLD